VDEIFDLCPREPEHLNRRSVEGLAADAPNRQSAAACGARYHSGPALGGDEVARTENGRPFAWERVIGGSDSNAAVMLIAEAEFDVAAVEGVAPIGTFSASR
jgi:hypothetical protein